MASKQWPRNQIPPKKPDPEKSWLTKTFELMKDVGRRSTRDKSGCRWEYVGKKLVNHYTGKKNREITPDAGDWHLCNYTLERNSLARTMIWNDSYGGARTENPQYSYGPLCSIVLTPYLYDFNFSTLMKIAYFIGRFLTLTHEVARYRQKGYFSNEMTRIEYFIGNDKTSGLIKKKLGRVAKANYWIIERL